LLVAVYFLPSFLVVAIGKGQLQNRHPKARHSPDWPAVALQRRTSGAAFCR